MISPFCTVQSKTRNILIKYRMHVTIMIHKEYRFVLLSILVVGIWMLLLSPSLAANDAMAAITPFALQDTKVSGPDPIPGHEMHDAVVILPPRNDSKIYSGTLTFSSSHPVELIVSHPFNLTQAPANNATFVPEPLTIPGQNTTVSILHELGQGMQFDTVPFTGSSVSLHNRVGQNFTVSYSIAGNLVDATGVPK
jgi:hypothetical protein